MKGDLTKTVAGCLVCVALLLVSACSAVIVDSYPGSFPVNYYEGEFEEAVSKGAIVTTVVGDPFSGRASGFSDTVRDLMKNQAGEAPVTFVSRPGPSTRPPYKVVVVFNPRSALSDEVICDRGANTPVSSDVTGPISVAMVFCSGPEARSGSSGRVGGLSGPNDPTFAALVRQVASAMVPPRRTERHPSLDN